MLGLPDDGKVMKAVECFVLRIGKIDSVGCIDLVADIVTGCVVVVKEISLAPVSVP